MKKVNTKIIVIPKKNARMVVEHLYFGAGWRNDPPNRQGLSHFLEHIIASDDVERIMRIRYYGGERIAQTYADFIRAIHYVPNFVWKENLVFLLDYLYGTKIRETKVISQKKFLAKEINHWDSYPFNPLLWRLTHLIFYPHPYSNHGVGKIKDIEKVTLSLLEHYRRCFWKNIMILVEGDVKEDEVKEVVDRYFEKGEIETDVWKTEQYPFPENGRVKEEIETEGDINLLGFGGMIKEPKMDDIVSLYILAFLLEMDDPVIKRILNKEGIPSVSTTSATTAVFFKDASAILGIIGLNKEIKSFDFSSIWYAISKEFDYFKEKVLVYQGIQNLWNEAIQRGYLYFINKSYNDFVDKLRNINKKTFLETYERLDREAIIFTRSEG